MHYDLFQWALGLLGLVVSAVIALLVVQLIDSAKWRRKGARFFLAIASKMVGRLVRSSQERPALWSAMVGALLLSLACAFLTIGIDTDDMRQGIGFFDGQATPKLPWELEPSVVSLK